MQGRIEAERNDEVLRNWIDQAVVATAHRVDDADGHRALADLWIQRYRIATERSLLQQQPWLAEAEAGREEAWQASSLFNLHNTMRELQPDKRAEMVRQIRDDPGAQTLLTPAWQHAIRARDACPWLPQTYLTLAALSPFVGDETDSSVHLEKARQYAGGDPKLWYQIGLLEMAAGRTQAALDSWRQSLRLSPQYEALILAEILDTVAVEKIVKDVLPDEPGSRWRFVSLLRKTRPEDARKIAEITLREMDAEGSAELGPTAEIATRRSIRARLLSTVERHEEAVAEWQKALEKMPDKLAWRAELVDSLLAAGRPKDAYDQVVICVNAEPESARLQGMLKRTKAAMVEQKKGAE